METYPTTDTTTGKPMPNCSLPISYGIKSNNISFMSDSGIEEVRPKGRLKQTFDFSYKALTDTQYKTLKDFYIARKGSYSAFKWTDPVSKEEFTVRFKMEAFAAKSFAHNFKTPLYSLDVQLEEVL